MFTPHEVEITAIGTGDLGFPTSDNPATPVVSVTLPQGVYYIQTQANVRKDSGASIFSCYARNDQNGDITAVSNSPRRRGRFFALDVSGRGRLLQRPSGWRDTDA